MTLDEYQASALVKAELYTRFSASPVRAAKLPTKLKRCYATVAAYSTTL